MTGPWQGCTSCGTPLPEAAAFCPRCGAATPTGVSMSTGGDRLFRVSARGGPILDDGPVPVTGGFGGSVTLSGDGRRAAAFVTRRSSDISLVRNFDPGGR